MLKSQRSQPGNPGNGSDLNDDWVRVCDTCGDVGDESLLVSCNKCTDGAAHTYCMRVKLFEKPKHWVCEDCAPTAGTNKLVEDDVEVGARRKTGHLSKSSINLESSKGAKFNSRSSYPSKSKTTGVSLTGNLSAQRHGVPLEAPTAQKARATERRAVSSGSSKPCKQSLLSEDFSCEESEWAQTKSVKDIVYSLPPRSGISQEKEKVPRACGDRKRISTLAQLDEKKRVLEGKVISHQTSTTQNHPSLGREPPSEKLRKAKLGAAGTATSLKPSSNGSFLKEKLTYGLGDGSPNLDSQIDIAQNKCSLLKSNSSKAANLKPKGQLVKAGRLQKQKVERDPTFHDDRKGKKEKETSSGSDTLFSGSRFCNPDAVGRSGQSDHRSRPSICKTHIDSNSTNKKKNVSQQAEHLAKAAAPMTGRASDEMPPLRDLAQVEATAILQGLVVPNTDCSWLGKFVIHNSEGIARNCDGVLAHLSSCASLKVLEVVDRLPRIIKLEELPRLRIWPSQFMGSQVTEENIGLYFFAKDYVSYDTCYSGLVKYMINNDLALKGNLDGVELLIFPSNILPERSQFWNQMMFLWGVFKVQKQGNGDTVK
ncbi:uncharacterized protein LOC130740957 isoform X2 [Lotus japonicus]|uniref:uncharacterized protein LOC130740957 isoform X2 n=1 Tax=Lotus japonicus TaxID=34305 RepID=UPI00258A7384|nr:uncharacterized protein LOC130740957 isoform X2 [Lotus japonicus]